MRPERTNCGRRAYTLMEMMAVVAILGVVAALIIPRIATSTTAGEAPACHTNQGEIETQVRLWRRINGSFPAANLGDIGLNTTYFPEGLPTCPVNGAGYTINATTGLVVGHEH